MGLLVWLILLVSTFKVCLVLVVDYWGSILGFLSFDV